MSKIAARLREECGVLGATAIVVLALAALFLFTTIKPLENQLADVKRQLEKGASKQVDVPTEAPRKSGASQLKEFYRFLETDEGKAVSLARIYTTAAATGLEIRSAEYRLADSSGRIERYQITLPVSATYPQLWAFIEAALAELPRLALDQVNLRRKSITEPRVEADLSFTLYLSRP